MPTVLRIKGYRFFFFAADRFEPPHIHVAKNGKAAKFWLEPVRQAYNEEFRAHEITEIRKIIDDHLDQLTDVWYEYFSRYM